MAERINVAVVPFGDWWCIQRLTDGRVRAYTDPHGWVGHRLTNILGDQYASPQAAINAARHDGLVVVNAVRVVPDRSEDQAIADAWTALLNSVIVNAVRP